MKWKREVSPLDKPQLVSDLSAALDHWQSRKVALGVHPARAHAKALDSVTDAIRDALSALGEDMTPHPPENPLAGQEVNLPVFMQSESLE